MARDRKGEGGFQSAAGLIRYFDSEADTGLKLPPWLVIGFALASAAIVLAINYVWPV